MRAHGGACKLGVGTRAASVIKWVWGWGETMAGKRIGHATNWYVLCFRPVTWRRNPVTPSPTGIFPMLRMFQAGDGKSTAFGVMYIVNVVLW